MKPYLPWLVLFLLFSACQGGPSQGLDAQLRQELANEGIKPLIPLHDVSPEMFTLGQALYFDKELSGNRDISCATCHHPALHTGDGRTLPVGTAGHGLGPSRVMGEGRNIIPRNSPTVFNRNVEDWHTMFWDGRVAGTPDEGFTTPAGDDLPDGLDSVLAAQAMIPVTARDEMRGSSLDESEMARCNDTDFPTMWGFLMDRVMIFREYRTLFKDAYPDTPIDEMGFQHAANAIAAFEEEAFTYLDSPWDRYLAGDDEALSEEAKRGALIFYGKGRCSLCHAGSLMTDQEYHDMAVPQLGPGKGDAAPLDIGRAGVTKDDKDRFAFRPPPLRNIELTEPYMHSGAYTTLEEAVRHMLDPTSGLLNYDPTQLDPMFQATVRTDPNTTSQQLANLDPAARKPVELTDEEFHDLMAFLGALTSPSARDLNWTVPESVPSGLPVED